MAAASSLKGRMRNLVSRFFFSSLCFALIMHTNLRPTLAIDDEHDFDYIEGSDKGPEHWGDLHEDWADCKNGTRQSPIDLTMAEINVELGGLNKFYMPSFASLRNRGHDIMLSWANAGSLFINGTQFKLLQCHWHSPSEHAINGQRYDLEIHMVHKNDDDNMYAVIGVLYKFGPPDPFLQQLKGGIELLAHGYNQVEVGINDPRNILMGQNYYRYMGSLTTPLCSETVIWTVANQVRTVSPCQVELLREAVHDGAKNNARPLQPTNGRPVEFYPGPFSTYGGDITAQSF